MAAKQFIEFERFLEEQFGTRSHLVVPPHTRHQLGGALISYIIEANHQGWDGYSSRDLTGIGRFLEDFARMFSTDEDFDRTIFTGLTTYPGNNCADEEF